ALGRARRDRRGRLRGGCAADARRGSCATGHRVARERGPDSRPLFRAMQQEGVSAEKRNAFSKHVRLDATARPLAVPQLRRVGAARLRAQVARFDAELTTWLSTPAGRFEVFYAERARLAA